jgi:hypothetical protein
VAGTLNNSGALNIGNPYTLSETAAATHLRTRRFELHADRRAAWHLLDHDLHTERSEQRLCHGCGQRHDHGDRRRCGADAFDRLDIAVPLPLIP